ncbi:hypothetical protein IAPFLPAM_00025 [Sulfurimonas phage SNW-1]|nr:hypothetical protein IAPFLPAM_00025 [Sulfurimonas phage SNW-1]
MLPTTPETKKSKNRAMPRYSFISAPSTPKKTAIKRVPKRLAKVANAGLSAFCNVFIPLL